MSEAVQLSEEHAPGCACAVCNPDPNGEILFLFRQWANARLIAAKLKEIHAFLTDQDQATPLGAKTIEQVIREAEGSL